MVLVHRTTSSSAVVMPKKKAIAMGLDYCASY